MLDKYEGVREFFKQINECGKINARILYNEYKEFAPKLRTVSIGTFVRWAPVHKERVRESVGRGEWVTHTIFNFGEDDDE